MTFLERIETAYLILLGQKKLTGRFLEVRIWGKNGKLVKKTAKVDTGAFSTSIDKNVIAQLGFTDIVELLESPEFLEVSQRDEYKQRGKVDMSEFDKFIEKYPSVKTFVRTFSGNGSEVRPIIELVMKVGDTPRKKISVNVTHRENLRNSVILGRKVLRNFLIDVNIDYDVAIKK